MAIKADKNIHKFIEYKIKAPLTGPLEEFFIISLGKSPSNGHYMG